VNAQLVPSQLDLPFAGALQGVHEEVPQLAASVFETQLPLQLWVPDGQLPSHALPAAMQVPLHSVVPVGHSAPHLEPSQVALPPLGTGQGEQPVPQVMGSVSPAQVEPQA
jgi:hypothetical protein